MRTFLKARQITQRHAAQQAGITPAAVTKWIQGSKPGAQELYKFASANGVSVESFLAVNKGCKDSVDINFESGIVSGVSKPVPSWPELKKIVYDLTKERGTKSALARQLNGGKGVSRQALGNWLSDKAASSPSSEITLELYRLWVSGKIPANKKSASDAATSPAPKARKT